MLLRVGGLGKTRLSLRAMIYGCAFPTRMLILVRLPTKNPTQLIVIGAQ
jgi:hypothetical protein